MPSRTTTKASTKTPATKTSNSKTTASKAGNGKANEAKAASAAGKAAAGQGKNAGGTLASAAAAAGRRRSVKAAQTEQRSAAPMSGAGPAVTGRAEHERMVAEAAYYRAQHRDFAPGHELDDWLDAEAEIERRASHR